MSTFEDPTYQWRETYFVFFDKARRPKLEDLAEVLGSAGSYELQNKMADDSGAAVGLTLISRDDHSAIDVSYLEGEEVPEEGRRLLDEFLDLTDELEEKQALAKLPEATGRFDLLHFESLAGAVEDPTEGEFEEMLDPSALLCVIETLVRLTDGVGIDPQSGEIY